MGKPHIRKWHGRWLCISLWVNGLGETPLEAWTAWRAEQDAWLRCIPRLPAVLY